MNLVLLISQQETQEICYHIRRFAVFFSGVVFVNNDKEKLRLLTESDSLGKWTERRFTRTRGGHHDEMFVLRSVEWLVSSIIIFKKIFSLASILVSQTQDFDLSFTDEAVKMLVRGRRLSW